MAVHIKNMCHAAYFKCMFQTRKNRRNLKNLRFFFLEFVSAVPN